MPQLGSQFENTYTIEPGKTAHRAVREKIDVESGVSQVEKRQAEHQGKPFRDYEYVKEEVTTPDTVTDYHVTEYPQGMLFAPETATYRPGDPLYPHEQRLADVKDRFKIIHGRSTPKSRVDELHQAIADSNFSKQELEQTRTGVEIQNQRNSGGSYNPLLNRIYMRSERLGGQLGEYDVSTFAHELGHAFDTTIRIPSGRKMGAERSVMEEQKGRYIISPTQEGIADGMSERYSLGGKLDDENELRLHPSHPNRVNDLRTTGGYTTKYSGWTNKQEQALYAATRLHIGMHGPNGLSKMPSVDELIHKHLHEEGTKWVQNKRNENEDRYITARSGPDYEDTVKKVHDYDYLKTPTFKNEARALFLGQLLHENPDIHESMHELGFGTVANHAVDTYRYRDAVYNQKQNQNQLKLWDEPDPKLTPPKKLTREQMRRDDYKPKPKPRSERLESIFSWR